MTTYRVIKGWMGVLAAMVLAAGMPTLSKADTIYKGETVFNGGTGTIKVSFNGNQISTAAGSFTTKLFASSTSTNPLATYQTYCVDLTRMVSSGRLDVKVGPNPQILPATNRNLGAATYLLEQFQTSANTGSATVRKENQAALQLAVWEALYDSNDTAALGDFSKGAFKIVSGVSTAVRTKALQYLNAAINGSGFKTSTAGLYFDYLGKSQDQLTHYVVPEPASITMAAIAMVAGLGVYRRRRLTNV